MEKIFKKSLALMVSAALCLTAFVGCLTVNAETAGSATVTVGEVTAKTTDTTVEVPVTIAAGADATTGIAAAIFDITVDSAKFDFSKRHWDSCLTYDTKQNIHVSTITNGDFIQPLNGTNNTYRFLVEGLAEGSTDENTLGTFTSATFKLTFDVIDNTAGETAITFNTDTMVPQACNAGTLDLQGNYTGDEKPFSVATVAGKITVQAAGPVLDTSLNSAFSSAILVSANLGVYYTVVLPSNYDDFRLVIERNTFDSSYNYTPATTVTFDKTNCDNTYAEWGYYYCEYTGIGMYELNVPVNAVLHAYKDGVEVAYSEVNTTTLAQVAKNNHDTTSNAVLKTMMADLLVMGTKAQVYFATSGSDLEKVAYPTDGFDTSNASTSYGELDTTSSATGNLSLALLMSSAPNMYYTAIVDTAYAKEDLTFEISYHNNLLNTDVVQSVTGDNSIVDSTWAEYGYYYCPFEKIALYDSNKTVTARVIYKAGTEEETVLSTNVSSIESYISNNIGTAGTTTAALFDAVAKFGVSARAYFPGA